MGLVFPGIDTSQFAKKRIARRVMIAITRLAIFCAEKCKTSETRTGTGAQRFSKSVQTDWQSCKI